MSTRPAPSTRTPPVIALLILLCAMLTLAAAPLLASGVPAAALAATKGRPHPHPSPTPRPTPTPVPAPGEAVGPPHPARIAPPGPCDPYRRAGAALAAAPIRGKPSPLRWRRSPPPLTDPHRRYLLDLRIGMPARKGSAAQILGAVTIQLDPLHNPRTVNAFLFLVCNGYYREASFDRLVAGSLVEAASPVGIAHGGPGFPLPADPVHASYRRGAVVLVDSGPDAVAGRFLLLLDTLVLPPRYTIFARVVGGLDLLDRLSRAPTTSQPDAQEPSLPLRPPRILAIDLRIATSL